MTQENFSGLNLTGSSGSTNRVLTISNTRLTDNDNFQVFVNNSFLHLNSDYTVNHLSSSTTITFLIPIWNTQGITVIYYFNKPTPSSGSSGILPLDTQYINNELNFYGNTLTLRKVTNLDYDDRGNAQIVLGDSKISYTTTDDTDNICYSTNYIAQTFTTIESIDVSSIKIKVKRTGTCGTLTVAIKATSGGEPTGSNLTSGSLDFSDLITDSSTEWIVLPLTSYTLSASTVYALVISSTGADSSNKYDIRSVGTGTYSGGNILTSSDSGTSWTSGSGDIVFNLYGDTETTGMVDVLTQEDEAVQLGQFQSGDLRINFQNSEDVERGDLIVYNSNTYEVNQIIEEKLGNTQYFLEAMCKKI